MKLPIVTLLFLSSIRLIAMDSSSQRTAVRASLPEEQSLISFDELPIPGNLPGVPMLALRLSQSEHDEARLNLPIVKYEVEKLERRYNKQKKEDGLFLDKALDHLAVVASVGLFIWAVGKVTNMSGQPNWKLFEWFRPVESYSGDAPKALLYNSVDLAVLTSTLLGVKSSIQSLTNAYRYLNRPSKNKPAALLDAQNRLARLQLIAQVAQENPR